MRSRSGSLIETASARMMLCQRAWADYGSDAEKREAKYREEKKKNINTGRWSRE